MNLCSEVANNFYLIEKKDYRVDRIFNWHFPSNYPTFSSILLVCMFAFLNMYLYQFLMSNDFFAKSLSLLSYYPTSFLRM